MAAKKSNKKAAPKKAAAKKKPAAKKPAKKPAPKKKAAPKKTAKKKPAAKKPAAKKPIKKSAPKKKPAAKKPVKKKIALKKPVSKKKSVAKKPVKKVKPVSKTAVDKKTAKKEKPVAKAVVKVAPKKEVKAEVKKEEKPAQPMKPQIKMAKSKPVRRESKKSPLSAPTDIKALANLNKTFKIPVAKPNVVKTNIKLVVDTRSRYSDAELQEFKEIILGKLGEAKKDLEMLRGSLSHTDDHGTDDTSPTFKMMEDGSETLSREETAQLAGRQEKFILALENALIRIENKTYGICRVTGRLINKERLKLVPHTTLSIEAKNMQD